MNYFHKANEHYNGKDYKRAISFYQKAIDNKENEACSYYNLAVCFIKLKEYEKAIDYIQSALKIKRESKYFFNLAYCYAMLNNCKKALIYFNTAWALNHDDSDCEKAINLIISKHKKAAL
ncbi:tetratricopeptide repeat protein [Clostridium hydrogeniformans]|uniref:tetratricopeptide repeat protein n=1 Tax=Clostridium hydrogeniformans TaxID=349933 RepID=UPI00048716E8|nr:tetratricopeptide repeat protein [Clostridium hydrogeniformans]